MKILDLKSGRSPGGVSVDQWVRCTKCGEVWALWPPGERGDSVVKCATRCGAVCRSLTDVEKVAGLLGMWLAIEVMR